jgi:hypothetical protein
MLTETTTLLLQNTERYNYIYEKIFSFFIFLIFTYWLNFFSLYLISDFVYKQECIVNEALIHSSFIFILSIPILIGEHTTRKLILVFISIIISVASLIVYYFIVNTTSWQNENIPNGCDMVSNIIYSISSTFIGSLVQYLFRY